MCSKGESIGVSRRTGGDPGVRCGKSDNTGLRRCTTLFKAIPALLVLLSLAAPTTLRAQRAVSTGRSILRAEARDRLVTRDTFPDQATVHVTGGRVAVRTGLVRARYRVEAHALPSGSPLVRARAYLRREAKAFGWPSDLSTLALLETKTGPAGTHLRFAQVFQGLPVHGRTVRISLTRNGDISFVTSAYAAHAPADDTPRRPTLSSTAAVERVQSLVTTGGVETDVPELVWYPAEPFVLAWRVTAWPDALGAEWEVLVDATTGEVLRILDRTIREEQETPSLDPARARSDAVAPGLRAASRATGAGLVFDPDPLTNAGRGYGPPFLDNNDANSAALEAQLKQVELPDISQGTDGLYRLEGPNVRIVGEGPGSVGAYVPPAVPSPDGFTFTRDSDFFEAVMAYYHTDRSSRYAVGALEQPFTADPVRVNPHGRGAVDDSWYLPERNLIEFGTGGIDDAEDGGVIWHEHAHAIMESISRGLRATDPGAAFHEGWSDYWAASYVRGLIESGAVPPRDWRRLFFWDGNETWSGRYVQHRGTYPDNTFCEDDFAGSCTLSRWYEDGIFWAATLMEVYDALGKQIADRLALTSLYYLSPPLTYPDVAEALIRADLDVYGAAHESVLVEILARRGLVSSRLGPALAHDPATQVSQEGNELVLTGSVAGLLPVSALQLTYQVIPGTEATVPVTVSGDGSFVVRVPQPALPGIFRYYFRGVDVAGNNAVLPANAPFSTFRYNVGTVRESDVLRVARAGEGWREVSGHWQTSAPGANTALVLVPLDLPANARRLTLELEHLYQFESGAGGNVQVSNDAGRTWQVLSPEGGYPAELGIASVFGGASSGLQHAYFDLSAFAGQQLWVRLNQFANGASGRDDTWQIRGARLLEATFDPVLTVPLRQALFTNYPDPFTESTTVTYTLEEANQVRVEVYDVLGRRIRILLNEWQEAGTHVTTFESTGLAAGTYFIHLTAGDARQTEKAVLLR